MTTLTKHLITYSADTVAAVQAAEQTADEILAWPEEMDFDPKLEALRLKYQAEVYTVLSLAIRDISNYRPLP